MSILAARCFGSRDIRVGRISGRVVSADSIAVAFTPRESAVRKCRDIGVHGGDLCEVRATGAGATLDLESRFVRRVVDPAEIDPR